MASETPQSPSFFTSAWFIARKDVAQFMRIRETLLWVFVMPILYFYFIGTVTGGFGAPSGDRRSPTMRNRSCSLAQPTVIPFFGSATLIVERKRA